MPLSFKPSPPPQRRPAIRPLADLVLPCIGPVIAKQGFSEGDILMHWPDIVGSRLADHCQPVKLQWRPMPRGAHPEARLEPATLIVRVEGGFAIALQHMTAVVVDRVNSYLGWRCVGKLALRQGPLTRKLETRRTEPPADPVAQARAHEVASGIDDDGLRDALVRLGSSITTKAARHAEAVSREK